MKRGWCPGVHAPMPTGDGLLARVKPPGNRLTSESARRLARAASRFGNGIVELTSRANLQVRGLTLASAPMFAAEMVADGLACADPDAERRRNVLVSPLAGDDAAGLGTAIEAMLAEAGELSLLPPKFLVAIACGGDVEIRVRPSHHEIVVGGRQAICNPEATVGIVRTLAAACGGRRMDDFVRSSGYDAAFALVGLVAEPAREREAALISVGSIADAGMFGLGLPFGQTDCSRIERLAAWADEFGDRTLRLSADRTILIPVGSANIDRLRDLSKAAAHAGFIVERSDRRLRFAACIGSVGCASGTVDARADAAALADTEWVGSMHVSGCAKGCAHRGSAPVTLVGEAGAYDVVREGAAGDLPALRGLSLRQVIAELIPSRMSAP